MKYYLLLFGGFLVLLIGVAVVTVGKRPMPSSNDRLLGELRQGIVEGQKKEFVVAMLNEFHVEHRVQDKEIKAVVRDVPWHSTTKTVEILIKLDEGQLVKTVVFQDVPKGP